ncbi:MAG: hypothetical protein LBR22_00720 [Desulfovibrio sp.]|jgi:hypothetical protein|nr:hypothetical protein [Desulfovibrio sp.]
MQIFLFAPASHERVPATVHDTSYVLTFPIWKAAVYRPEHSYDLVFSFSMSRTIEITGFFKVFAASKMPTFEMDGLSVPADEFLRAFAVQSAPAA